VDNLRRFARRTEGQQWGILDADAPVESVLKLLGRQLSVHGIEVVDEREPRLKVRGNLVRLQQVVMNLITNARNAVEKRDASDNKRIGIRMFLRPATAGDPAKVVCEISDNGIGIPEDIVSRIYEPFFTTKDAAEGTGLGLTIVWQIVEEHGGKIQVQSQAGKGTVFRVLLPAETDP
jgi:signal transduction histidine kinase